MNRTTEKTKDKSEAARLQAMLPILGVMATVKNGLYDLVMSAGLRMLQVMLEQGPTNTPT